MPKKLKDHEQTSFEILEGDLGNLNSLSLVFDKPNLEVYNQIDIEIADATGRNGVYRINQYQKELTEHVETNTEKGYKKVLERDGIVVIEKFKKGAFGIKIQMKFLIDNRFVVNASANNIEPDEFWGYIKILKLDKLN